MPVQQLVSEDERPEQQCDGPGSGKSKPSAVTARSEEPSQWSPRMKSFHQWGRWLWLHPCARQATLQNGSYTSLIEKGGLSDVAGRQTFPRSPAWERRTIEWSWRTCAVLSVLHAVHPSEWVAFWHPTGSGCSPWFRFLSFFWVVDWLLSGYCLRVWQSHITLVGEGRCTPPPAVASGADWGGVCTDLSGKGLTVH